MKSFFTAVVILTLVTTYTNCSSVESQSSSGTPDSSTPNSATDSEVEEEYASANMSGIIKGYQDLKFRFRISGASSGATYQVSNLPSWATLDSSTGEITGVPTNISDHSDISITVTSSGGVETKSGPFTISVIGDPLKTYQWHLKNTGQSAFAGSAGISDEDIHLSSTIENRILGKSVRVAISDTGILESHRSLSPNLIANASRNYLNNYASTGSWLGSSSPDTSEAENAHGTAVAGLLAERGWLGFGARGVAPLASISGFLFIQAQSQLATNGYYTAALLDQFQGDFDAFNYSWGEIQCALFEHDTSFRQRLKSVRNLRGGKGALYVKAAGNEFVGYLSDCYKGVSSTAYYLGNAEFSEELTSPYTIAVTAVNAEGLSSSYSSPGANIWISAPGGEFGWSKPASSDAVALKPALLTSDFSGCSAGMKTLNSSHNEFDAGQAPNTECEHTAAMNGTSGATPIVTGAIALMLSAKPSLTWRDVRHILASTADKIDADRGNTSHPVSSSNLSGHVYQQGWVTNAAGFHFHNWYGFGRVNIDKAVDMAKSYSVDLGTFKETNSGETWKYDSGVLNVSVPKGSATGVSRGLTVIENFSVEAIQIRLSATNCIGNLGVELTSPSGTKSILMNINSGILDSAIESHIFLSNAFYGEPCAGTWTLKLIGAKSTCATTWNSWQLNVMGH